MRQRRACLVATAAQTRRALCVTGALLLASLLTTSGCASRTIFSAQFEKQPIGSQFPPSAQVGSIGVGPFGGVRVVTAPDSGDPDNWVEILPNNGGAGELRCFLSESPSRDGRYLFTGRLYIPHGSRAFITFTAGGIGAPQFLRIDFPGVGGVLPIPGTSAGGICCFPHDEVFSLSVDLSIGSTSKATVTLLGTAQGSFEVPITPCCGGSFGAVIFTTVFTTDTPHSGNFFVNDLSVLFSP